MIWTVKNSNLAGEPDREITSLPNSLHDVCNTSTPRLSWKIKELGLAVNPY